VPHTEIEVDLPTADQQSGSDDEAEDIELIDDTDNENENENGNEDEVVETVVPIDELAIDPIPSRSIDCVNVDEYPSSNDRSDDDEEEDDDDGDFNSVRTKLYHDVYIYKYLNMYIYKFIYMYNHHIILVHHI
jgi:hypothetical protein